MKEKLVLIGNGMAGMRTVDELLKLSSDKFDITVFGAEPHGNYNRIMLSPVLAGDKKLSDIIIHDLQCLNIIFLTSIAFSCFSTFISYAIYKIVTLLIFINRHAVMSVSPC